jgi:hypothetical protein
MALAGEFAAQGVVMQPKRVATKKFLVHPKNAPPEHTIAGCSIYILKEDRHYGDIAIYTVFSDGIARRADLADRVYFNPKMSVPAWYYEGHTQVEIAGHKFRACREPEMMCAKVYGESWRTRFRVGDVVPGYNKASGSFFDSDIEMLWAHALANGWDTDYSRRPAWPSKIDSIRSEIDRQWIYAHQPDLRDDLPEILRSPAIERAAQETSPRRIAQYMRLFIAKTLHYSTLKERAKDFGEARDEPNKDDALRAENTRLKQQLRQSEKKLMDVRAAHRLRESELAAEIARLKTSEKS